MVTIGRKGLHIYDVDKEEWIMNSTEEGHQYESLHEAIVRGDIHSSSDESESDDEMEEGEMMPELEEQKEPGVEALQAVLSPMRNEFRPTD